MSFKIIGKKYIIILNISVLQVSTPDEDEAFLNGGGEDCWICYDRDRPDPLIRPCKCSGDVSSVHHDCLRRWLVEASSKVNEIVNRK